MSADFLCNPGINKPIQSFLLLLRLPRWTFVTGAPSSFGPKCRTKNLPIFLGYFGRYDAKWTRTSRRAPLPINAKLHKLGFLWYTFGCFLVYEKLANLVQIFFFLLFVLKNTFESKLSFFLFLKTSCIIILLSFFDFSFFVFSLWWCGKNWNEWNYLLKDWFFSTKLILLNFSQVRKLWVRS